MTFERHVDIDWSGNLMEGNGTAKAGTGAFTLPVTFASRVGEPAGKTSPEELIAASHAACYAMVVAGALGRANATADSMTVTAKIGADKGDAGIKIVSSALSATVKGLKGIDAQQFDELAKQAEGRCPVSNALRGALQITVTTHVS